MYSPAEDGAGPYAAAATAPLHGLHVRQASFAVATAAARRSCSGNSSLVEDAPGSSWLHGTRRRGGRLARTASRRYLDDIASASLRQKLAVLNPLLLMDLMLPMLHPACRVRIMWDTIMLVVVLYVAVVAPLKISFSQMARLVSLHVIDYIVSACLSLDVVANFRTAYISPRGELIRDSRLVASRYIRGLFLVDVAAAIPFAAILGATNRATSWLALLKLIPLLRLIRLMKGSGLVGSMLAMARLLTFMLLVAHWACCFWHYLSEAIPEWPWMFTEKLPDNQPSLQYLLGFYSSFLLLLGDRPAAHNNLERAVVTCLLFLGTLLYAIVMGSMALLVASIWAMASRHKQRAAQVDDALRYRGVSTQVRAQVGEYFDYLAQYQHPGSDGVAYLQELPVGLYNTVMGSMFGPRLAKVQLFAYCERPFLWRLAQRLRLSLFMPGDTIYDVGSVGHDMYIIWKGAVGLVGQSGDLAALLSDGDHFGELGVMSASVRRPHHAVALRPSDLLVLSRWDLQEAMKDFPESASLVKHRARSRLEDHEAPANNLWAFLTGWEQLLDPEWYGEGEGDGDGGFGGGGDGGGGGGVGRSSPDSALLQSRAVLKQLAAEAAAQKLHLQPLPQSQPLLPPQLSRQQREQQHCHVAEPGCSSGGVGSEGGGLRAPRPGSCLPPPRVGGGGPVAEALEGASSARGGTRSSAAATVVTTVAAASPRSLRGAIRGLGGRLTGLLRGRGARSAADNAEASVSAAAAAAPFTIQDEEDAISQLAASSGLSMRAPSSAVLQALIRQGQTQTAAWRRSLASPAPAGGQLSSSGPGSQQHSDTGGPHFGSRSARAWGSQDGNLPGGGARQGRIRRSSVECSTPPAVAATGAATAGGGARPLTRQRSRKGSVLWLETFRVEEFSGDDDGDNDTAVAAPGGGSGGAWRPLRRKSSEYGPKLDESAVRQWPGRPAHGSLRMRRQPQHPHSHDPVETGGLTASQMGLPGGIGTGASLPHEVHGSGDASPPPGMPVEPRAQGPSPLPSLEEVWKQIQRAAGSPAQAQAGQGPGSVAGQNPPVPAPSPSPLLLRTTSPFQEPAQRKQPPSPSQALQPPHMQSFVQRQTSRGSRLSVQVYCALPPRRGSSGGGDGLAAATGQVPSSLARRSSGGGGGCFWRGSCGGSLPKMSSLGIDLTDEGLGALAPAVPLQPLATRAIVGPFGTIPTGQGLLSPVPRSPKTSMTGVPPPSPSGRVAARGAADPPPAGAGSPAAPGARVLVKATSYGRARYSSYNSRTARSSAGYTATSSGPTTDGLGRATGAESVGNEDDDGGWSSDSSREESRRLVAALRAQLGQANARVLVLESELAAVGRDPLKVPAVAAAVQREARTVLLRACTAVDARLAGVNDLLAQMTARAEELAQMIVAADARLQRLEDEQGGGSGVAAGPGGSFHDANAVTIAAGPGVGVAIGKGYIGSMPGSGSGKLTGLGLAGALSSALSQEALQLSRRSDQRQRSCSGVSIGTGMGAVGGGLSIGGGLLPLSPKLFEARLPQQLSESEGLKEWHRSLTGGLMPGSGSGGGPANGSRRATGSSRMGPQLQAPLQSILKSGAALGARMSGAGVLERAGSRRSMAGIAERDRTAVTTTTATMPAAADLASRPLALNAPGLLPALPPNIAGATAVDKDASARRGRTSHMAASGVSAAGGQLDTG